MAYATPTIRPARSSAALSDASSIDSFKTSSSRRKAGYSHPLYSVLPAKQDTIIITTYEAEESAFSSCSTSPNSSCASLDAFPMPCVTQRLSAAPSALSAALSTYSSARSSRSASCASSRFADEHYPLITSINTSSNNTSTSIVHMAHAFNTYIRAANSCYNHALTVETSGLPDFLFFNQTLFNILSHHLKVDSQYLQPLLHIPGENFYSMSKRTTSIHENSAFTASFHAWANYIHDPATLQFFCGEELQAHFNRFAPVLVEHLHDVVSRLNALVNENTLSAEHLGKIWAKFESTLSDKLDLYTDAALLVGCHDRQFTINGQRAEQFPKLPMGSTTMVRKWHSRRYEGAWQYCSSDFDGKRRVILA